MLSLECRCQQNRCSEPRCSENRCLENKCEKNRCWETRCSENTCLENRCEENDAERLDAQRIDAKRIDAQMPRENTVEKSRVLFCGRRSIWWSWSVTFCGRRSMSWHLKDSWSAKRCIFQYKIVSKMGQVRSAKRRVRDDDFIVGMWSNHPSFGECNSGTFPRNLDVRISWQVQYLVRLEGDFTCSAHWKWRFICDADQSWDSFCVAGAVFGEVGVWLFVAGAACRDILKDSWSAKRCIFQYKIVSKMGQVRSAKRRVRDDDFIVGMWSNHPSFGECNSGMFPRNLDVRISWQAQYLVSFKDDFTCSAHWKSPFICHADQWWDSFSVAGAVFGEVGGWLYLLCALEMTFHMWCRSMMKFILRGRRNIWWSWRVTPVVSRIVNPFHMWGGSMMRFILRGSRSIWWSLRIVNAFADARRIKAGTVRITTGVVLCSTGVLLCSTGVVLA